MIRYIYILLFYFLISHITLGQSINYQFLYHDQPLELNKLYITSKGDSVFISTFRFYISNIKSVKEDGIIWKDSTEAHLIDAEDSATWNLKLPNFPELNKIKTIYFDIGVDSLANVSGAMGGDLDAVNGMYWAWNSGYINMKLEGKSNSCKNAKRTFEFHIGGYLPGQNTLRHLMFDWNSKSIEIIIDVHLDSWLDSLNLKDSCELLVPGNDAMKMADIYTHMFQIHQ